MVKRAHLHRTLALIGVVGTFAACAADERVAPSEAVTPSLAREVAATGAFRFSPLPASAVCTVSGGDPVNPLVLPAGYSQQLIASEPDFGDNIDMSTQNESGPQKGRFLYRAHEVGSNGMVSVTDLRTGLTRTIAQRADWEALDPTVWTPWGTLLVAEETNAAGFRDPQFPQSVGGLVYELVPNKSDPTVIDAIHGRPAIGAKSHEGMRFDKLGNLYSISERTPGYIFRFVPDTKGDLSSGQTYVLRLTRDNGDRTGPAEWVPLDRTSVEIDVSLAADAVGATGYGRPEDVELGTSSGSSRDGENTLYVAITSEHRILAIKLRQPSATGSEPEALISDYVRVGVNAPADFTMPDNLALDRAGNLFITEDPGGSLSGGKVAGDDIWVATPRTSGSGPSQPAASVARFASLNDCDAEPTGVYYDLLAERLFVNVQHRGGDRIDKAMVVFRTPDRM